MKILLAAAISLLLAACALGGRGSGAPAAVYDFGPVAAQPAGGASWPQLALDVRVPEWLDASPIVYRLAYEDPLKLRQYAGSRWAGAPGRLIALHLQHRLGLQSAFAEAPACQLRLEVQEFSQIFDSERQSRAVLLARARLYDAKRRLLAEKDFSLESPAATADAHGGAAALAAAADRLGGELGVWLAIVGPAGYLNSCRAPLAAGKP